MSIPNTYVFAVQVSLAGGLDAVPNINPLPTGGATGMATLTASYIYNVTDLSGNVLGTGMTPMKPRTMGISYMPGRGIGTGYYDASSTFQLLDANERPAVQGGMGGSR
jgi:hypothetical protein